MTYLKQLPEQTQRMIREQIALGVGWEDAFYRVKTPDMDSRAFKHMYFRMLACKRRESEKRRTA